MNPTPSRCGTAASAWFSPLRDLFYVPDGPHTRDLRLAPGEFGLGRLADRCRPDALAPMVCGYCSTGCQLNVHLRRGDAVALSPSADYPVNLGMACPKGWEALTVLGAEDRATAPLLRTARGRYEPCDWPTALRTFVARMKDVQRRHGAESVAFLSTGQIPTEEMALLGALAKFGMGVVHGDGNTRQCMATAVVAYKQSFGFDAPPYTYRDFEESDVIVLVGSNLCLAHPILWERILRNGRQPKIVVVDPRRTETAMQATHHYAIRPKSDLVFFYGLAHVLIERGWIDREFIETSTSGFDEFAAHVRGFPPEAAAGAAGIAVERLHALAELIHAGPRVSFWWTMGVNQSYEGVRTAQSLINLALMTGNIGRPGTGANSITGQCNAMGSRLFSNTTCLLGGREFTDPDDRKQVADGLGIDIGRIPDRNSWAYPEIVEGILRNRIKALWVIATNPAHSWINQTVLREVLGNLEFLVVQDMYHSTETAQLADLVLPAAGWGEKEGTFINSERRIGRIRRVVRAPGEALADFSIFRLIAEEWGAGVGAMFRDWSSPEAVFHVLKRLSAGRPCDFTGIRDYRMLDELGGVQWPFPERDQRSAESGVGPSPRHSALGAPHSNERRLFEDGRFYHADARARFLFEAPRPLHEAPGRKYPLLLLTGRGSASQWHTQTRTRKSPVLRKLYPEHVYVEINPADAQALGIRCQELVTVESARGSLEAKAFLTHGVQPGQVFVPMHYETVNRLTDSVFDPYSRQPSYKACAVGLRRSGPPGDPN